MNAMTAPREASAPIRRSLGTSAPEATITSTGLPLADSSTDAAVALAAASDGSDPAALMPPPPVARTIEPDQHLASAYAERYDRFRALYAAAAHAADA